MIKEVTIDKDGAEPYSLETMAAMHRGAVRALDAKISKAGKEACILWYKMKMSADSFCNIVFRVKNLLVAVLPVLSEGFGGKSGNPEIDDIPGIILLKKGARLLPDPQALGIFLLQCEENNMIPCFFPMTQDADGYCRPAVEGWNLWGVEQGHPLHPEELNGDSPIRLSDWELHRKALCHVMAHIVDKLGGEIVFYHDPSPIAPQIFFSDAQGRECCVSVEAYFKGRAPLAFRPAPPMLEAKMENCLQYKASVGYCPPDFRDGRPYRGEMLKVQFDGLHPVGGGHGSRRSRCAEVLLGVMAGDMIGSIYEGRHSHIKEKDGWPLFKGPVEYADGASHFTDDTSMTMAVCRALSDARGDYADLPERAVSATQAVGRKYFWGFGGRFRHWIRSADPQPYGSWGNGAAMRVSPCALAGRDLDEVKALSRAVTAVTHNHEEGIKGAEAVAVCIFLALQGKTPAEVQAYCHEHYYPMDFMVDDIRSGYGFDVSCQGSVPQALKAAFEGPDYESAIRSCVALGGDADTQAAIAGGLAAALYGLPEEIARQAWARMPQEDLREVFLRFEAKFSRDGAADGAPDSPPPDKTDSGMPNIVLDLEQGQFGLGLCRLPGSLSGCVSSSAILAAKLPEVEQSMQELGLRNISIYHPVGADAPSSPIVHATWEGQELYICFPEEAEDFFGIGAIPLAAADYFEKKMPEAVVCHAAFFLQKSKMGTGVDMVGCRVVRAGGEWLELPGWDDHLPFEKRRFIPRLDAFLGPLALMKNRLLHRATMAHGELVDYGVENLYGPEESGVAAVKIKMHPYTPHYALQGTLDPATGEFKHAVTWFCMEYPEQLTRVEVQKVVKDKSGRCVLELTDRTGVRIHADCVECTVVPEAFYAGQSFEGNVVLYASRCKKTPLPESPVQSLGGDVGPGSIHVRHFTAKPGQTIASAIGSVESAEWLELGFTKLWFITLQCMLDNDDFHLHVYARPEALGGYRPKEGDIMSCSGFVQFVCTRLV